jgi:hypothetical protein
MMMIPQQQQQYPPLSSSMNSNNNTSTQTPTTTTTSGTSTANAATTTTNSNTNTTIPNHRHHPILTPSTMSLPIPTMMMTATTTTPPMMFHHPQQQYPLGTTTSTTMNMIHHPHDNHNNGASPSSFGIRLALQNDIGHLSDYQIMVRQQLEIFEATMSDVECNTQGRKKPVILYQVGLRCCHCAYIPLRSRGRGAVYYPAKLHGVYQAAQNMAITHLCTSCPKIIPSIKDELNTLRLRRDNANGGKQYWADGCRAIGIIETEQHGLRFASRPIKTISTTPPITNTTTNNASTIPLNNSNSDHTSNIVETQTKIEQGITEATTTTITATTNTNPISSSE